VSEPPVPVGLGDSRWVLLAGGAALDEAVLREDAAQGE
jgi:hypothetical protein